VTAKARAALAEIMRELARENGIPIIEDIALARVLLYRRGEGGSLGAGGNLSRSRRDSRLCLPRAEVVTGLLRFGLREVPHETCRPGRCSRSRPRICPAQRPLLAVAVLGVVALLILPLPGGSRLTVCWLSASAWRCSSCWSRWAWLVPSTSRSSRLCCWW